MTGTAVRTSRVSPPTFHRVRNTPSDSTAAQIQIRGGGGLKLVEIGVGETMEVCFFATLSGYDT